MTRSAPGRPKTLLIVSSIAFALWIAALLVMYFTTVYPQRYPNKPAQTTRVSEVFRPSGFGIQLNA